jgi:hypothetical protein
MGCGGSGGSSSNTGPVDSGAIDAGWSTVGGGEIAANAAAFGKLAVANGVPYAVFEDELNNGQLTVMKFTGAVWVTVGKAGFTPGDPNVYEIYVDGITPYVAFISYVDNALNVMKFDGTAWVNVGAPGFATAYLDHITLTVSGGIPYVAFADDSSQVRLMSFVGSTWSNVGGPAVAAAGSNVMLAFLSGSPYMAYYDSSTTYLVMFNGTAWVPVATSDISIDENWSPNLAVSNGTLYLTFYNYTNGPVVLKLNGSTLESVGPLGSIANGDSVEYVSGTVYNGVPYVAFDDEARDSDPNPKAATVKFFNGTSWQLYAGYPDPCDIEETFLASDQSNGRLYLTYNDCNGAMTVQVH